MAKSKKRIRQQKLNKLKKHRVSGSKSQKAYAKKYIKRQKARIEHRAKVYRAPKIQGLNKQQKEISFQKLANRVNAKVGNLQYFEQQYYSMASKIKTLPLMDLRFSADEMGIDIKNTLKEYSATQGRSYGYSVKIMKDILKTAEKFETDITNMTNTSDFRTNVLGEALFRTFMSDRFQRMSDSANSNTYDSDGDNLAHDTLVDAVSNVKGINKDGVIDYINKRYKQQGLVPVLDKTLILAQAGI